jgi:probable rRNA maturation factor
MKTKINFFSEDTDFKVKEKTLLRQWINATIAQEGYKPGELNFIFCSDDYLLNINQEYLDHDTYTDIITFDNSEKEEEISGDIFISVQRVQENAAGLGVEEAEELRRVIIHGVLHLTGCQDKSPTDKALMTGKEDFYLAKYKQES